MLCAAFHNQATKLSSNQPSCQKLKLKTESLLLLARTHAHAGNTLAHIRSRVIDDVSTHPPHTLHSPSTHPPLTLHSPSTHHRLTSETSTCSTSLRGTRCLQRRLPCGLSVFGQTSCSSGSGREGRLTCTRRKTEDAHRSWLALARPGLGKTRCAFALGLTHVRQTQHASGIGSRIHRVHCHRRMGFFLYKIY